MGPIKWPQRCGLAISPPYMKEGTEDVDNVSWQIYALSEHLLVFHVFHCANVS